MIWHKKKQIIYTKREANHTINNSPKIKSQKIGAWYWKCEGVFEHWIAPDYLFETEFMCPIIPIISIAIDGRSNEAAQR